ncbi:hypothetical protein VitviT2T_014698 [Vitis vinifera]|uniref:DUF506 family protein n=2 Tax=Vitis vinifera TaxID=29760 RepID=A0A438EDF1_VITVI|nr:uncharacterized protein LOC116803646 [Vitis vinifera]RVW45877.1 hypothetical protein CK203_101134 [Vitis vinifera]RVX08083.1 hypothetical protein CK203_014634 [Vitis vinifera]WJZ95967.1 hypothetical protein VitviT2T_014698 [Vitis vinifera]
MAKIPVRFKRVAAAFDEVVRARPCDSWESESSTELSDADLSDLVNSFLEEERVGVEEEMVEDEGGDVERETDGDLIGRRESYCSDSETKEALRSLLGDEASDDAVEKIRAETELACRHIGSGSSSKGFKRRLMNRLRERGFDAGLCKSRWGKTNKRSIPGDYEYVDVNIVGTRYVVEVFLAGEFEIARATKDYISLLEEFPPIFVGKQEELKQIVRIMSRAMKGSMKSVEMHVPPWRRNSYMQAKWFGSYKRTTSAAPPRKESERGAGFAGERLPEMILLVG